MAIEMAQKEGNFFFFLLPKQIFLWEQNWV